MESMQDWLKAQMKTFYFHSHQVCKLIHQMRYERMLLSRETVYVQPPCIYFVKTCNKISPLSNQRNVMCYHVSFNSYNFVGIMIQVTHLTA
jgi:hypothetical protein